MRVSEVCDAEYEAARRESAGAGAVLLVLAGAVVAVVLSAEVWLRLLVAV